MTREKIILYFTYSPDTVSLSMGTGRQNAQRTKTEVPIVEEEEEAEKATVE